jgi:hypothetical protein
MSDGRETKRRPRMPADLLVLASACAIISALLLPSGPTSWRFLAGVAFGVVGALLVLIAGIASLVFKLRGRLPS